MASDSIGRGSRGPLHWVCSSKSEEDGQDQRGKGSWEEENYRGEEEKLEVYSTTSGQSTSGGCHPFGEHWRFPDCRN